MRSRLLKGTTAEQAAASVPPIRWRTRGLGPGTAAGMVAVCSWQDAEQQRRVLSPASEPKVRRLATRRRVLGRRRRAGRRDEAGNLIGKGDLRAQIEQVGKNVSACLNAGGQRSRTSSSRSATSPRP